MSNTAEDGGEGSVATDCRTVTEGEACTKNKTETDAFITSSLGSLGEYKMDNKGRGHALIFNQECFFRRLGLGKRDGTNVDRDSLEMRLKELNFEVETHNNLKQMDVLDKISEGSVATDSATATHSTACTKNQTETDAFIRSSLGSLGEYKMDNKRRGHALIFNHEHFSWLRRRTGTNIDRDNLEMRLKELNFEVETHNDLKQKDVLDKISEAAGKDHSDADCFLLVFLSHGENAHVWAYDEKISIQDITSKFKGDKCRSLVGKPKIFIFQACRGDMPDNPATACAAGDEESDTNDVTMDTGALYTLPAGADFIMCYSVAEGYFSFREPSKGSWYVQDLCDLLQKSGDSLEFTELLTWVNCKVSMRTVESSKNPKIIGKKQVPCFASMLTKKLFFKPKK